MKRIIYILIFILVETLILKSCARDEAPWIPESGSGETAEISFLINTPSSTQISTRGQSSAVSENSIDNIYVLVFDKNTGDLCYKSKGKNLSVTADAVNNNKVTFTATLPVGQEYTFMVLANAESELEDINTGMSPAKNKSDVLEIALENMSKWDNMTMPIPMWGEKDMNLTASSTPSFELARMLARINVEVNLRDINGVPVNNFELTSVRFYNYNTSGALVPAKDNYNFNTNTTIYPTIPYDSGTQTGSALIYDGTDIMNGSSCKEKIYVFEIEHNGSTYTTPANNTTWINNPCVVIGGKYTTQEGTTLNETFYRIDLIKKDNNDPNEIKESWLSVLRNFSYNITIVEVNGSGFNEPEVALKSAPINMEANILEWNESNMGNIVFDGVFYLSVSRDNISVVSSTVTEEKEENLLYIKTDYMYDNDPNHSKSGWYVEKYVDKITGEPVTWLKLNPDKAAPDANNAIKTYFTFEENNTGAPRTAVVWIAAGRLRYPVYVTQRLAWIEIVDPNSGQVLDELFFEVPAGGISEQLNKFRVKWGPANETVAIEQSSRIDWASFEPGWISPNPSNSWKITTGTGNEIYEVRAPSVDFNVLAQDPFYEKESVYSFTVGNGQDAETASIRLHQIYYNILIDVYNYRLDGKTHHMSIRSNTEWEIINIEEWLHNKPPSSTNTSPVMLELKSSDNLYVGANGGPNINGDAVSFTVVDNNVNTHRKKWGTVYVTFRSPTGKFVDQTVALKFPHRDITLLGLGYARDVRAYNSAFNTSYHLQGVNRMLTSPYNFGELEESTVQIPKLNIVGYNCENVSGYGASSTTPDQNWKVGDLKKWLNEHNPDIITISYSMILNEDEERLLVQYLDHGGAIIMYYGEGTLQIGDPHVLRFLQKVFNAPTKPTGNVISEGGGGGSWGAVYQLPAGPQWEDDPILNGPFSKMEGTTMEGKYWGMNRIHYSINLSNYADQIVDYTGTLLNKTAPGGVYTTVFRHKTKILFFVPSGGATGSYYPEQGWSTPEFDAMRNDQTYFRPAFREGYGPSGSNRNTQRYTVCNAFVYMNAIAWAIEEGNHVPPDGGY